MVNHGRTLLLNTDGNIRPGSGYPAEEFVPFDYTPLQLNTTLTMVRDAFFGPGADRAMINYRLRQLMAIVHSTELGEYLTDLDSRITYLPITDTRLFRLSKFGSTIRLLAGTDTWTINLVGNPNSYTDKKKLLDSWNIEVLTTTSVRISHNTDPFTFTDVSFAVTGGIGSYIPLPGLPFGFVLVPGNTTDLPSWSLSVLFSPDKNLSELYTEISNTINQGVDLFGTGEPFETLKNVYENNVTSLPYKLGAVVVAWIYRAEALRQARV